MSSGTAQRAGPGLRVIEPKLMPPRVHPGMLKRTRLYELLDGDGETPLTVVNAAVGYGKTTLVRSWCVERPETVIWITLDAADDDPVRLWTHLATAVERLGDGLGSRALACLATPGGSVDFAVDELMNGLLAYGRSATLVLDDLHALRSEASLRSIAHGIERLPANARVVVLTRSEPLVGVPRARARRALAEVRARELAFTFDEASELVARERVGLSGNSIELLVERTEGWPAGLYLAMLWLRDHEDPDRAVRAFAGSARQVGDYLTEEVLSALAPQTRDFLVRSSVLGRFTPELCDAVLGREGSAAVLAELERSNMFLVGLDARGGWYRYHHLFGEVLQLELGDEAARELRSRAAGWCRANGLVEEAIEYAAVGGQAELVADLLAEHHLEFIWAGRFRQLLAWIRWLPYELLVMHPVLPAAAAVVSGVLSRPHVEIARLLAVADESRETRPQLWSPYIETIVELTRSALIQGGDVGRAVEGGRRVVATASQGAAVLSVAALACLAQALFFAGELDESRRVLVEVVERPDAPDRPAGYLTSLGLLALIDAEQGRSESAEAWARQAIRYARQRFQSDSWLAASAHLGLALACAGTDRLDEAEREASRGERLRRSQEPTVGHVHALLVLAHVRVARSRLAAASSVLERAKRAIAEFPDPGRLPAAAAAVERDLAAARASTDRDRPVEQPSPAELAVLRGLAAGLSRRQIGAELYISINTVKTHMRELYRKLGVTSQAEAVARSEALGLLDHTQSPG